MCLGGGGGYTPPPTPPKPVYEAGPPPPPDMVNDQVIDNANPRDEMEANQNAMDPKKAKLKVQSSKNPGMM